MLVLKERWSKPFIGKVFISGNTVLHRTKDLFSEIIVEVTDFFKFQPIGYPLIYIINWVEKRETN